MGITYRELVTPLEAGPFGSESLLSIRPVGSSIPLFVRRWNLLGLAECQGPGSLGLAECVGEGNAGLVGLLG